MGVKEIEGRPDRHDAEVILGDVLVRSLKSDSVYIELLWDELRRYKEDVQFFLCIDVGNLVLSLGELNVLKSCLIKRS